MDKIRESVLSLLEGLAWKARDADELGAVAIIDAEIARLGGGVRGENAHAHRTGKPREVWRSGTRQTFGLRPVRLGDRVVVWTDERNAEPGLAMCVEVEACDQPVFFSLARFGRENPAAYYFGADLRFVPTLDLLARGTWARVPWLDGGENG